MSILQSILLGILQGCTEFLPVSSSGHLVLAKALMHIRSGNDISFEIFTHFGTLLSVLVVFRSDIMRIGLLLVEVAKHPFNIKNTYRNSAMFRFTFYLFAGCIPAGVLGLLFDEQIEGILAAREGYRKEKQPLERVIGCALPAIAQQRKGLRRRNSTSA